MHVAYVALFGVLLVPVDYYYISGEVSISVIVYPVALVSLLLLAILDPRRAVEEVQVAPLDKARNQRSSTRGKRAERSTRRRTQRSQAL